LYKRDTLAAWHLQRRDVPRHVETLRLEPGSKLPDTLLAAYHAMAFEADRPKGSPSLRIGQLAL
jgi:hypothetical protein